MKVTMIRSSNGCVKSQKDNLRSLGLKKIGDSISVDNKPEMIGRLRKIWHLVRVEND